jgi:hypothetical protein
MKLSWLLKLYLKRSTPPSGQISVCTTRLLPRNGNREIEKIEVEFGVISGFSQVKMRGLPMSVYPFFLEFGLMSRKGLFLD